MSEVICTECGHVNAIGNLYCDECGFKLPMVQSEAKAEENESKPIQEFVEAVTGIRESMEVVPEPINEEVIEEVEETTPVVKPKRPSPMTILDFEPEPEPRQKKVSPLTILEAPLVVLIHEETGTRFELPLGEKEIYIGKENEELTIHVEVSDLPHADIVSRVQATIVVEKDEFYLEDAGSLNGTHLNDEEVKAGARYRKLLKNGDKISFGRNRKVHLIFTIEE